MRNTWRWISITAIVSLLAVGVTSITLRAVAQTAPSVPAASKPPPASDAAADSSATDSAPPVPPAEEAPDLRQSADNNISYPIDI